MYAHILYMQINVRKSFPKHHTSSLSMAVIANLQMLRVGDSFNCGVSGFFRKVSSTMGWEKIASYRMSPLQKRKTLG